MSESDLYRDALEALILMATAAKDARQDTEQRLKGYGTDITTPQYRLLRQLQQGRSTIKELSQTMLVEPATLVPMVDTLERHGFIRRGKDPHDRRRTPLELTETGLARLRQVPFVHEDDPIARYFRQLTDADRRAFLQHLRDLVTSLHGDNAVVRRIAEAVNGYFDFGEQQDLPSAHQSPETTRSRRAARRASTPSEESRS